MLALYSASVSGWYPPPLTYFTFAAHISRPLRAESLNDLSPLPPTSVTRPILIFVSAGFCPPPSEGFCLGAQPANTVAIIKTAIKITKIFFAFIKKPPFSYLLQKL